MLLSNEKMDAALTASLKLYFLFHLSIHSCDIL